MIKLFGFELSLPGHGGLFAFANHLVTIPRNPFSKNTGAYRCWSRVRRDSPLFFSAVRPTAFQMH